MILFFFLFLLLDSLHVHLYNRFVISVAALIFRAAATRRYFVSLHDPIVYCESPPGLTSRWD